MSSTRRGNLRNESHSYFHLNWKWNLSSRNKEVKWIYWTNRSYFSTKFCETGSKNFYLCYNFHAITDWQRTCELCVCACMCTPTKKKKKRLSTHVANITLGCPMIFAQVLMESSEDSKELYCLWGPISEEILEI